MSRTRTLIVLIVAGVVVFVIGVLLYHHQRSNEVMGSDTFAVVLTIAGFALVALALLSTLVLGASGLMKRSGVVTPPKRCPDCAERVQAAAKVCKHCGYRFAP